MTINWGALSVVAAVSLVIVVLVVVLVSLALVGLSAREPDPAGEPAVVRPLRPQRAGPASGGGGVSTPGWMASASVISAADTIAEMFRYDAADGYGPTQTSSSA